MKAARASATATRSMDRMLDPIPSSARTDPCSGYTDSVKGRPAGAAARVLRAGLSASRGRALIAFGSARDLGSPVMTSSAVQAHPIDMTVGGDLKRSRLTVFLRLIIAIPHLIWIMLWGIVAELAVIVAWFAALFTGRVPEGLHD